MRGAREAGANREPTMPYRVDVRRAGDDALDRLIELGALDVEPLPEGGLAALEVIAVEAWVASA